MFDVSKLQYPFDELDYQPGAFAEQAAAFNAQQFLETLRQRHIVTEVGKVCTLYNEHEQEPVPPSWEAFYEANTLPVPDWVLEFQYQVLDTFRDSVVDGWELDLFITSGVGKSLGAHYDNDDVYTIQLVGEKHWLIDSLNLPRLKQYIDDDVVFRREHTESWVPNEGNELMFLQPTELVLKPGDYLAMPAFAMHHVTTHSEGLNVSLNVGIRRESVWEKFLGEASKTQARL